MRILVIGGNSAVGLACAQLLADVGHQIAAPSQDLLDVRREFHVGEYIQNMIDIDALVYSAGINYLAWSEFINAEGMMEVYNVNVLGLVRCLKYFKHGTVVVIGSDAADMPMRTSVAYNASKAALNAAVKCIARERAGQQTINIVSPGKLADTAMTKYVEFQTEKIRHWSPATLREYELSRIPLGRYGDCSEVAEVVRWLIEDAPDYLHGEIIKVNGGR